MASTAVDGWQRLITVGAAVTAACLFKLVHRQACAAREESRRANELKDTLLATVSHELRTPLNAIIGWVHVMKSGNLKPEEHARALGAIERNAVLQARRVTELLDISRLLQGRLQLSMSDVDLRTVLRACLEDMTPDADAKGVVIEMPQDGPPVIVRGDPHRLREIAVRLLSNAVKFTPRGGRVSLELLSDGARVELRVRDTGEGIPAEYLPHVFEPFTQGKTQSMRAGLGLGLAFVQKLVALHGGRVWADSRGEGRGATFSVRLPLMRPA